MAKLLQDIEKAGKGYCPPASFELSPGELSSDGTGAGAQDAYVIKCEEDLFLVCAPGACFVCDKSTDTVTDAEKAAGGCDALEGWQAQLHFAPGFTADCGFGKDTLVYEGETYAAKTTALRGRTYLVSALEGRLVLVVDAARFLFYGAADGRPLGGNIVNMELD